jgi:DNA polymerase-3 subunit epsilon
MRDTDWLLLGTQTAEANSSIPVIEIAAQRMRGWERDGQPFQRLLNRNEEISAETLLPSGYTREIFERDGESPKQVYAALRDYAGDVPIISYDLARHWDNVLIPEWRRLGIAKIGSRGFCALHLALRLLDPVPVSAGKLEMLRQYYRLPNRGDDGALRYVDTVADLFLTVLKPKAEAIGLNTWEGICNYTVEEWYPSRFAFGKFKGHTLFQAIENQEILKWLESLSRSVNTGNARIGAWYLKRLKEQGENPPIVDVRIPTEEATGFVREVIIYRRPEIQELRKLVATAQERLAEVEAAFSIEKRKVDALRAKLFEKLRADYERRDRLRLVVRYRKSFIEKLLRGGDEEAAQVREQFRRAEAETRHEYESAAAELAKKKELSAAEEKELKALWKDLVKLYHPDRFQDDPEKQETFQKLTQAINQAKDKGDLDTLREIAADPDAFIRKQGWASVELAEEKEINALRRLLEILQIKIVEVIEATNSLRESLDYELYHLWQRDPSILDTVSRKQQQDIEDECTKLTAEAADLEKQIEELTGEAAVGAAAATRN